MALRLKQGRAGIYSSSMSRSSCAAVRRDARRGGSRGGFIAIRVPARRFRSCVWGHRLSSAAEEIAATWTRTIIYLIYFIDNIRPNLWLGLSVVPMPFIPFNDLESNLITNIYLGSASQFSKPAAAHKTTYSIIPTSKAFGVGQHALELLLPHSLYNSSGSDGPMAWCILYISRCTRRFNF